MKLLSGYQVFKNSYLRCSSKKILILTTMFYHRAIRCINYKQLNPIIRQVREESSQTLASSEKTLFPTHDDQTPDKIPEKPLVSLNIIERINKVDKKGSFCADLFTGGFDHDYLIYPEPLYDRNENKLLKDQAAMVKQLYPRIWDDKLQLQKYNFHNMFQLSVTEMMTIFEAIGASIDNCRKASQLVEHGSFDNQNEIQTRLLKSVISLITRSCLTYWPIHKSDNQYAKKLIPERNILFGGLSDQDDLLFPPIGFCWTEQAPNLGSLVPQEWQTTAKMGSADITHHLITGLKNSVLFDESIEHYLIFYRDKYLAEKNDTDDIGYDPNPASDPFIGCSVVHKSELNFSPPYYDSIGLQYVDINIDTAIPNDRIIFPAKRKDPRAVNIKSLGQLASCSVTMGILKAALSKTYRYLIDYKSGLLTCDIIQKMLSSVTSKIFAIESMIYYIAGIYDGLEDGFDVHLETSILKVVTYDHAYSIIQELQQVNGSEMFRTSKIQDQVNVFDSFLDGNIYNRLYLSTMGVLWYARSKNKHLNQLRLAPWHLGYYLRNSLKEISEQADWMNLSADIHGHLHPSLSEAATNLEYIVKRIRYATDDICKKFGEDVTAAQSALYRLSQISIDAFMLTAMCSRTSKSYCNGSRNSELDVTITTAVSIDLVRKTKRYISELQAFPISTIEIRSKQINEENLKAGGYYAESPLDPNI